MAKVDFHVHVTPPEISTHWQKYAEREAYFSLLSSSKLNKYASAEDIVSALGESGFDRAVIFGFAFKDQGLCRYVNDYVIEKVRQFPKLTGFMSISPNEKGMEKEIDRCFAEGLRGIGELYPDGQGFEIDDEKETRAFSGCCIERKLPLILHVNEPVGHDYIGKNNIPLRKIERFINNSQSLNVVLAHWGGGLLFYETMPEIKEKFRNVYYDTAVTPFLYDARIYRVAKALGLEKKILFGSDFPLLPQSRYLSTLDESGLSSEEKRLILGGNACGLLSRASAPYKTCKGKR
jgi:predicted TIM-barrel fold metal-dependent hydrolase